jgi:hypothetical protein
MKRRDTNKLDDLEKRINEYLQHCLDAEKVALEKLSNYPTTNDSLSAVEILRRERLRHHTQSLLLKEIKEWIHELKEGKSF